MTPPTTPTRRRRAIRTIAATAALAGLLAASAASSPGASAAPGAEAVDSLTLTPQQLFAVDPVFQQPDATFPVTATWSGADPIVYDELTLPARVLVLTCLATATTTAGCYHGFQAPDDVEPPFWPSGGVFAAGTSGSEQFGLQLRGWIPGGGAIGDPIDCFETACAVGITDRYDQINLAPWLPPLPLDVVVPVEIVTEPPATSRPDALIAKSATGPFKGAGTYSTTPLPAQTAAVRVTAVKTTTFWVRAVNRGDAAGTFRFKGIVNQNWSCQVTYRQGQTNITTAVRNGNYSVTLPPGARKTIKVVVRNTTAGKRGKYCNTDVTVRRGQSVADKVRARVYR